MCDVVVVYRVGEGADVTRPRHQPAPGHCRHAPRLNRVRVSHAKFDSLLAGQGRLQ